MYLSGYLHRDPSLGNVLIAPVQKEQKKKPFEIPKEFMDSLCSLDDKDAEQIREQCKRVEELVGKLEIPDEFHAVIGDGDLAVPWKNYFNTDCRTFKSVSDFPVS